MPELKTSDSIMQRMDEIVVERLTMPRDRSMLRVYLHAPFLIQKRDIFALEAAVKQTYFKTKPVTVRVYEHFTLKTLSPKEAFEAYRDSILYDGWTTVQTLSDVDWRMLNMLYHPAVHPGMTWPAAQGALHDALGL